MPSPERTLRSPLAPLLAKELREVLGGRALWTMLLLLCPLIGFSFVQAIDLYGEASAAAPAGSLLASSLSPFDGVLVPTFGAFYLGVTLLFPFVAIRVLGSEKETGALRLLLQLPYRRSALIAAKLAAILGAWSLAAIPVLSALPIWLLVGGHIGVVETGNLLLGHLLYGLLIGSIALFAASIAEGSATAAIITLAFTIGSWVLDFTTAGQSGWLGWVSRLSLTQALRTFEQGLFSIGLVAGIAGTITGLAGLATTWISPGARVSRKIVRSTVPVLFIAMSLAVAAQLTVSRDVTEDRRNSFSAGEERALASLSKPLTITVHLATEDPRYVDLQRNVLSKLERIVPRLSIRLASGRQAATASAADDRYGEIAYDYDGRIDVSRSTSPREILPLIYALVQIPPPTPAAAPDYPGYPLVAKGRPALAWFFGGLPALILFGWWWTRRAPSHVVHDGERP